MVIDFLTGPYAGRTFPVITSEPIIFGRHGNAPLPDTRASRQHARLTRHLGRWVLEDLNSRNGTFLNDQRVRGSASISEGDTIIVGRSTFVVRELDAPDRPTHVQEPAGMLAHADNGVATVAFAGPARVETRNDDVEPHAQAEQSYSPSTPADSTDLIAANPWDNDVAAEEWPSLAVDDASLDIASPPASLPEEIVELEAESPGPTEPADDVSIDSTSLHGEIVGHEEEAHHVEGHIVEPTHSFDEQAASDEHVDGTVLHEVDAPVTADPIEIAEEPAMPVAPNDEVQNARDESPAIDEPLAVESLSALEPVPIVAEDHSALDESPVEMHAPQPAEDQPPAASLDLESFSEPSPADLAVPQTLDVTSELPELNLEPDALDDAVETSAPTINEPPVISATDADTLGSAVEPEAAPLDSTRSTGLAVSQDDSPQDIGLEIELAPAPSTDATPGDTSSEMLNDKSIASADVTPDTQSEQPAAVSDESPAMSDAHPIAEAPRDPVVSAAPSAALSEGLSHFTAPNPALSNLLKMNRIYVPPTRRRPRPRHIPGSGSIFSDAEMRELPIDDTEPAAATASQPQPVDEDPDAALAATFGGGAVMKSSGKPSREAHQAIGIGEIDPIAKVEPESPSGAAPPPMVEIKPGPSADSSALARRDAESLTLRNAAEPLAPFPWPPQPVMTPARRIWPYLLLGSILALVLLNVGLQVTSRDQLKEEVAGLRTALEQKDQATAELLIDEIRRELREAPRDPGSTQTLNTLNQTLAEQAAASERTARELAEHLDRARTQQDAQEKDRAGRAAEDASRVLAELQALKLSIGKLQESTAQAAAPEAARLEAPITAPGGSESFAVAPGGNQQATAKAARAVVPAPPSDADRRTTDAAVQAGNKVPAAAPATSANVFLIDGSGGLKKSIPEAVSEVRRLLRQTRDSDSSAVLLLYGNRLVHITDPAGSAALPGEADDIIDLGEMDLSQALNRALEFRPRTLHLLSDTLGKAPATRDALNALDLAGTHVNVVQMYSRDSQDVLKAIAREHNGFYTFVSTR